MAISPVLARIIDAYGWRYSYLLFAALNLLVLPMVLLLFVSAPRNHDLERPGDEKGGNMHLPADQLSGLTGKQALQSRMFWIVFLGFVLMGGANQTWNINAAPFYGDLGIARVEIGTLVALTSFAMMVGKPALGILCDRFGARGAVVIGAGSMIVGYGTAGIAAAWQLNALAIPCALLLGLWLPISTTVMPVIAAELFGRKEYGVCVSYCQMGDALGASLLPVLTTMMYDVSGNYKLTFSFSAATGVAFMILLFIAYRQRIKTRTNT